jgi:hypothetical protein
MHFELACRSMNDALKLTFPASRLQVCRELIIIVARNEKRILYSTSYSTRWLERAGSDRRASAERRLCFLSLSAYSSAVR